MGVQGLSLLLRDASPDAIISDQKLRQYSGKVIAMDASQYLYQSMSARRFKGQNSKESINKEKKTSPLLRTFYSCITLLENGIKPVYVFDGKPPQLKARVLKERVIKRKEAVVELKKATEKNDEKQMEYLKTKTVKVGVKEVKHCRGLLQLLGIPYLNAPGEAEAQCAVLVDSGHVYASATQDMDALTYGTKVVLRHLPIHSQSRFPMEEIHLNKVLHNLQLSLPEFIDLSIILGCDYCEGIRGLGAHRAIELIHKYRSIENILDNLDKNRVTIPDQWMFKEARSQFLKPRVIGCNSIHEFKWRTPNHEGVVKYLSSECEFDEILIRKLLDNIPSLDTRSENISNN